MSIWQVVREWLLNVVFPESCCGCSALGSLLCAACENRLKFTLKPTTVPEQAPDLDSVTVLTAFDELSHRLILTYKYSAVIGVGAVLADLIARFAVLPELDMLTAIPLHQRKQVDRGFNQSVIVAQNLGALLKLPVDTKFLLRSRSGSTQAQLHRSQRWKHAMGLFSLDPRAAASCAGRHIGLVDDVFTTGATLQACAHQLKKAGAASVHGICFTHGH